jgi:HPt (histidine-containing phosphotransfer) domain-containing protein
LSDIEQTLTGLSRISKDAITPGLARPPSWTKTEVLERLGGDEDLLRELCQIFLEESPKLMQRLRRAVADGDSDAAMQAAHSLKGQASYLGAGRATRTARQLEDMGREENLSQAAEMLAELEWELACLHFAMTDPARAVQ